jgi:phenylpyruvate tautomerase PptA (4-oxalocrotonate tautomerase family)
MPVLKIQTNCQLPDNCQGLLTGLSSATADLLGKSESYVMVSIEYNPVMLFAGNDQPMAYIELKSIGLPEDRTSIFAEGLCRLVGTHLDINPDRIYIEFSNAKRHLWGWNKTVF